MLRSKPSKPKPLTISQVAKLLKDRGLKASSPAELEDLTRMMNADREREAEEAARARSDRLNARFFEVLSAPVLKERAEREEAAKKAARKKRR